ncbi:SIR2 family protein [Methanoculleus sp.]|uniref:SIR2 family protein n=1 Tax=Methanoculleus sp. TaxID=90427 RepID=UPI0025E2C925|nr:SIR2 family protein [Methanoculleus sp.]
MRTSIDWDKPNILYINRECIPLDDALQTDKLRSKIEPWLSAIFQSEHLSLLVGNGLAIATAEIAELPPPTLNRIKFETFGSQISGWSDVQAEKMGRGIANFEDDLRSALELLNGLRIQNDVENAISLEEEINTQLVTFINQILETENKFINIDEVRKQEAIGYLKSFLVSFASRAATRDRLHIFTTNYDRFIEYGCDLAGIIIFDRFIGKIHPVFRSTKIEFDCHYNPPGIRGEPRYVEGVVRFTKLHGSIDWLFYDGMIIRDLLPFGADGKATGIVKNQAVIYPNSAKGIDTAYYPYSELFRDFSSAVCRPNSTLVIYGYSFGDSHINTILEDMLTIPSTHMVIIAYGDEANRIKRFVERNNAAQFTLLIGNHFGDLRTLSDNYLPKAAIDRITEKKQKILERRGFDYSKLSKEGNTEFTDGE